MVMMMTADENTYEVKTTKFFFLISYDSLRYSNSIMMIFVLKLGLIFRPISPNDENICFYILTEKFSYIFMFEIKNLMAFCSIGTNYFIVNINQNP